MKGNQPLFLLKVRSAPSLTDLCPQPQAPGHGAGRPLGGAAAGAEGSGYSWNDANSSRTTTSRGSEGRHVAVRKGEGQPLPTDGLAAPGGGEGLAERWMEEGSGLCSTRLTRSHSSPSWAWSFVSP